MTRPPQSTRTSGTGAPSSRAPGRGHHLLAGTSRELPAAVLPSGWSTNRWAAWVTDALVVALLRDG
jgi:hypothetical protein